MSFWCILRHTHTIGLPFSDNRFMLSCSSHLYSGHVQDCRAVFAHWALFTVFGRLAHSYRLLHSSPASAEFHAGSLPILWEQGGIFTLTERGIAYSSEGSQIQMGLQWACLSLFWLYCREFRSYFPFTTAFIYITMAVRTLQQFWNERGSQMKLKAMKKSQNWLLLKRH